jgi:DNA-binding transcriptional regulator YiaG
MTDENVHRNIRELRIRLGMTQEEFAHAVAVTFSTVNRWENGHAKPSKLARRAIEAVARRGNPRRETGTSNGDHLTPEAMVAAEPHQ